LCDTVQVDNAHLSVATLTDEPISKMNSIDSAPKILAVVVGKGDGYAAADGFSDGKAVMPQVCTCMRTARMCKAFMCVAVTCMIM
jgi:hypothetical protein